MRTVRGRHYAKFYSRSDDVVIRVYDHCSDVAKVKAASDTYRMEQGPTDSVDCIGGQLRHHSWTSAGDPSVAPEP